MPEAKKSILCPICHKENERRPNARFCRHCGHDIILNNDTRHQADDGRQYMITRVIKEGGQGAVYEGVTTSEDGRRYAIKEMLDRFVDPRERDEAVTRFSHEADLLKGLSHPYIPRIYSHFQDEGRHYLAMDFVEGEDLDDLLEREGAQPERRVLEWADQICDVLNYLHGKGLVYRDMKPSNVMLDHKNGGIKLVDFGIAKLFKPAERGTQIGTPGYAPPEQYQGIATPASDIYALGATLHHLLTGWDPTENPPFSYPPARNLKPEVSRRTSDVLEQALKMKPEERYGSVAEMRALLRPLVAQPPVQVRVAPATTVLPAQPQVAAPAPVAPVDAAPRQAQPPAPPRQAQPVARPRPQPVAQRRKGGFGRFVSRLLLALTLLGGAGAFVYFQYPQLLAPLLPAIEQVVPQPAPTAVVLVPRLYEPVIEVTLPADADRNAIIAALRAEYERMAKAELGASTIVNQNVPPSIVGALEILGEENGQARYRAQMSGRVQAPQ
jgi:serine/threonine-protein kinase